MKVVDISLLEDRVELLRSELHLAEKELQMARELDFAQVKEEGETILCNTLKIMQSQEWQKQVHDQMIENIDWHKGEPSEWSATIDIDQLSVYVRINFMQKKLVKKQYLGSIIIKYKDQEILNKAHMFIASHEKEAIEMYLNSIVHQVELVHNNR